jgi:hypothetical protein
MWCRQENNVIAVRLCARFLNWKLTARHGYLVIELGPAGKDRPTPCPC